MIMAINVYLQNLKGEKEDQVFDLHNSLARLWPISDPSFPLLQYIDPYGNVIFNGMQMPEVRKELELLVEKSSSDEQKTVLRRIHDLAVRCQDHPHKFLRFRGD
jgi:hypothetical protein